MSEALLFGIGFVMFVVTTTATLLFGYLQFNRLYRDDLAQPDQATRIVTADDGTEILRPAPHRAGPVAAEPS